MTNEIVAAENVSISDQGFTVTDEQFYNTLALDTIEGKKATLNAVNNSDSLNDYMETPLEVVGIITTPGVRKSRQQGAPDVQCQNTYLVCADGKSYMSQSQGIARSANLLHAMFTPEEIAAGLKLKCVNKSLKNGNTLKSLELL